MELDVAKKLINKYTQGHADFIAHAMTAERYYAVRNDIMFRPPKHQTLPDGIVSDGTPLRKADNKIPFSFYKLLVDLFSYGIVFQERYKVYLVRSDCYREAESFFVIIFFRKASKESTYADSIASHYYRLLDTVLVLECAVHCL